MDATASVSLACCSRLVFQDRRMLWMRVVFAWTCLCARQSDMLQYCSLFLCIEHVSAIVHPSEGGNCPYITFEGLTSK